MRRRNFRAVVPRLALVFDQHADFKNIDTRGDAPLKVVRPNGHGRTEGPGSQQDRDGKQHHGKFHRPPRCPSRGEKEIALMRSLERRGVRPDTR